MHIRDGVSLEIGGWFEENVWREVGNGENTFFLDGSMVKVCVFKR